jgi:hypothetical protein
MRGGMVRMSYAVVQVPSTNVPHANPRGSCREIRVVQVESSVRRVE